MGKSTMRALVLLSSSVLTWAQHPIPAAAQSITQSGHAVITEWSSPILDEQNGCANCGGASCQQCLSIDPGKRVHGGADFLFVRPSFSESVAFARGSQSPTSLDLSGQELEFDYDSSVRAFVAVRSEDGLSKMQFTYWHLRGKTSVNGTVAGPGQFIVDPFGNIVGSVAIVDPSDARSPNVIVGGDNIQTRATVRSNLYDFDFARELRPTDPHWFLEYSVGVRIADIDQYYESTVADAAGTVLSRGDFAVEYMGAGPRLGAETRRYLGRKGLSFFFATFHTALLLGDYDVAFHNAPVPVFQAGQTASATRMLPVMEAEIGTSLRLTETLNLSAAWLFQAWMDLGTSGGKFGGLYAGADDANIMSFDGLIVRAQLSH